MNLKEVEDFDLEVPVYRVPWYRLSWSNIPLYWLRRLVLGFKMAAEYRTDFMTFSGQEHIRLLEGMPESVEKEVVKHEIRHHRQFKEGGPSVERKYWIVFMGGIITMIAGFSIRSTIVPGLGLIMMVYFLYKVLMGLEDDADKDMDKTVYEDLEGYSKPETELGLKAYKFTLIVVGLITGLVLNGLQSLIYYPFAISRFIRSKL